MNTKKTLLYLTMASLIATYNTAVASQTFTNTNEHKQIKKNKDSVLSQLTIVEPTQKSKHKTSKKQKEKESKQEEEEEVKFVWNSELMKEFMDEDLVSPSPGEEQSSKESDLESSSKIKKPPVITSPTMVSITTSSSAPSKHSSLPASSSSSSSSSSKPPYTPPIPSLSSFSIKNLKSHSSLSKGGEGQRMGMPEGGKQGKDVGIEEISGEEENPLISKIRAKEEKQKEKEEKQKRKIEERKRKIEEKKRKEEEKMRRIEKEEEEEEEEEKEKEKDKKSSSSSSSSSSDLEEKEEKEVEKKKEEKEEKEEKKEVEKEEITPKGPSIEEMVTSVLNSEDGCRLLLKELGLSKELFKKVTQKKQVFNLIESEAHKVDAFRLFLLSGYLQTDDYLDNLVYEEIDSLLPAIKKDISNSKKSIKPMPNLKKTKEIKTSEQEFDTEEDREYFKGRVEKYLNTEEEEDDDDDDDELMKGLQSAIKGSIIQNSEKWLEAEEEAAAAAEETETEEDSGSSSSKEESVEVKAKTSSKPKHFAEIKKAKTTSDRKRAVGAVVDEWRDSIKDDVVEGVKAYMAKLVIGSSGSMAESLKDAGKLDIAMKNAGLGKMAGYLGEDEEDDEEVVGEAEGEEEEEEEEEEEKKGEDEEEKKGEGEGEEKKGEEEEEEKKGEVVEEKKEEGEKKEGKGKDEEGKKKSEIKKKEEKNEEEEEEEKQEKNK